MNNMGTKMITKNMLYIHVIIFSCFILYLVSANFLFDQLIPVNGESRLHTVDLPQESKNIRYSIDSINLNKLEWKEIYTFFGWAIIEGQNTENTTIFLVFTNESTQYIFTTQPVLRYDVTAFLSDIFENKTNLDNSGFEANVPKGLIDDKRYQIGILIENRTTKNFIKTKNYCFDGKCFIEESRIVQFNN